MHENTLQMRHLTHFLVFLQKNDTFLFLAVLSFCFSIFHYYKNLGGKDYLSEAIKHSICKLQSRFDCVCYERSYKCASSLTPRGTGLCGIQSSTITSMNQRSRRTRKNITTLKIIFICLKIPSVENVFYFVCVLFFKTQINYISFNVVPCFCCECFNHCHGNCFMNVFNSLLLAHIYLLFSYLI
jgi:hypothetical protein